MTRAKQRPPRPIDVARLLAAFDGEQWIQNELEKCRTSFARGERRALATAIQLCEDRRPLPTWAAEAFATGFREIIECKCESWDEILGGNPSKRRLAIAARKRAIQLWIDRNIHKIKHPKVDDQFFKEIAEALVNEGVVQSVTPATVQAYYRNMPAETKRQVGPNGSKTKR